MGVNGALREIREQESPLATLPWQQCIVESEQKLPGELFQQHWWGTGLRQGRAGGEPGSGREGLVGSQAQAGQGWQTVRGGHAHERSLRSKMQQSRSLMGDLGQGRWSQKDPGGVSLGLTWSQVRPESWEADRRAHI